jgi:hypothetical protein
MLLDADELDDCATAPCRRTCAASERSAPLKDRVTVADGNGERHFVEREMRRGA